MSKTDDRSECIVCGRTIGTATGWDQYDTFGLMLYGFQPTSGVKLPTGTINIHFERGTVERFDDEGNVIECIDLVSAIKDLLIAPI